MNKIQNVFATLTARYGKPQPKDGQQVQAIAQSWQMAVGRYSLSDLQIACAQWMSTSKYPRWPEPAEVLEILREVGCKPEAVQVSDNRPYEVRQAQHDSAEWFKYTSTSRAPDNAFPFTMEMAIKHVIGTDKRQNTGKKLGQILTEAWLRGDIPNGFDTKAAAYFADMQERKRAYWDAVKRHGHVAVNERRVRWLNQ
jgi:hypothetical protein